MADDLSRLKIAKKAYVFDMRKKFAATRNFQMKKKAEGRAEDIKANVLGLLRGGKAPGEEKPSPKAAAGTAAAPVKSGPFLTPLVMAILVIVLIIAGAGLFVMLQLNAATGQGTVQQQKPVFAGAYDFSIQDSRVLSVLQSDKTAHDAYLLVDYSSSNLSSMNFTVQLFPTHPASQVFLLDYARDSADSYPAFHKALLADLADAGLPVSEIEIDKVPYMPAGGLLIVPTGYLPKELLGMGSGFTFKDLLARGVTIIYIGLPFNDKALDSDGLTVATNYSELIFTPPETSGLLKSTDGFQLSNARYQAGPPQAGSAQGGFSSVQNLYGSVSAVRYMDGYMILVPQSLDGGWHADGGPQAAKDISRMVEEELWLSPIASAQANADLSDGGHTVSLFSEPFTTDSAYVKFVVAAQDSQGLVRSSHQVFFLQKTQLGDMTPVDPQTVPYYLSGEKTTLNIDLHEQSSTPVKLHVQMYKDGILNQTSDVESGLSNPQTYHSTDVEVDAEPGNYTVLVEDDSGKVYAATQLSVIGLDISQNTSDWAHGKFSFLLSANGQAVSPPDFTISLDGKNQQQYFLNSLTYTSDQTETVANYDYGGEVKPGNHAFYFSFAGKWNKELDVTYTHVAAFWENPIVIFLAVLSAVVFGIGVMLRRPEVLRYGLDIPDFPPLSTIKIPVKRQTVLEIFDSVNAAYSWQWMPLRTEELKNGFRKLTYNGKPILIGDFNLERMLAHLKTEGLVKEEIGYWGLARWEKDSRHSIPYLTVYRIMRNVFVNNAVKFSKLDAMPDCDLKAIAGKEEIYMHIMEQPYEQKVHRALATSKRGTTIMVFPTEEERDSFLESLTSTSKLAVGLKMEVNSGNILLLPVKNAISAYLKGIMK